MPARCAASRQASHSILGVIGLSAREPLTVPGNKYVFGLIHGQYSRNVSSSFGLSGTSRSRRPLP